MELIFDLLTADEIDCRIGTTKQPKGENAGGVSLLLYKDARCDMTRLDKTVGAMGWQRSHSRENANCTVSIWDDEKKMWISKEDTGVASRTEAEKGLASDSFKRACVNWGIGRELYTAPFIWISGDPDKLKWERFKVKQIGYDNDRNINALVIVDKRGKVVFKMGEIEEVEPDTPDEEPKKKVIDGVETADKLPVNPIVNFIRNEITDIQSALKFKTYADARNQIFLWAEQLVDSGAVKPFRWAEIDLETAKNVFAGIRKTFVNGDAA